MPEYGEPLTEREKELLQLVATGVTNRQVAKQLSISVNTVKVHLRNVFTKLGAESRTEATMIAVREGWVIVENGDEMAQDTATTTRVPPTVPLPSLPLFKRVTLIATLLLTVAGVAMTGPHSPSMEQNDGPTLPQPQPAQAPLPPTAEPGPWHERAQMPTRRAYLALAAVEGQIFAIAGRTPEGVTGAVEIYDPKEDLWTRGSNKPIPVTHVSAAVVGTSIYVPGGCDDDGQPMHTVEVYDARSDSWRETSSLPEPRCAYALAVFADKLYLFGGWDGNGYAATVYIYDTQAGTWGKGKPMDIEHGFAAAAPMANRIYVAGGHNDKQELSACRTYDPAANEWETCASLTVERGGLGLVALGDQLYAVGGQPSYLGFSERYSPDSDTWNSFKTPLVGEWRSPGVVAVDNIIYAIGGWSNDYLGINQAYEPLSYRIFIPVAIGD